jgi:signal transduction histidine kinase
MAGLSDGDARLLARNAELAAWADRAGHDLRTPLAVISGMAETLEAAWDRLGAEDRGRMLASIRNQAAKAAAMVDEAVALARATDPAEAEPEP